MPGVDEILGWIWLSLRLILLTILKKLIIQRRQARAEKSAIAEVAMNFIQAGVAVRDTRKRQRLDMEIAPAPVVQRAIIFLRQLIFVFQFLNTNLLSGFSFSTRWSLNASNCPANFHQHVAFGIATKPPNW